MHASDRKTGKESICDPYATDCVACVCMYILWPRPNLRLPRISASLPHAASGCVQVVAVSDSSPIFMVAPPSTSKEMV